jgi:hypothetical protein
VGAREDPLDLGEQRTGTRRGHTPEREVRGEQRRTRLEQVAALREPGGKRVAKVVEAAAPHQFGSEEVGAVAALPHQRGGQPHAEKTEPVEQCASGFAREQVVLPLTRAKETVDGQQYGVRVVAGCAGQGHERPELVLPQRAAGLREQPGDSHDVLAQAYHAGIRPVPGGDTAGGLQRVQSPAADLVGP